MTEENYFSIDKYHLYNGTKIWIPSGYVRSVTNTLYRRFPNTEKEYTEYVIQNVRDIETEPQEFKCFKSDSLGIICDLISNNAKTPGIYITHKQIGTFIRNENKAMLSDFDKEHSD